jgi:hypothetical protein
MSNTLLKFLATVTGMLLFIFLNACCKVVDIILYIFKCFVQIYKNERNKRQ